MSDNPARVPFNLSGPSIMTPDKQFSIHVSRTLDCLGKSQDMVKYRVKMYRENQRQSSIINPNRNDKIAGSKGEGLTSIFESDHDYMFVCHDIICADDVSPYTQSKNTTVFQTDRHDTPASYTKLKLVQEGQSNFFKCSIFGSPFHIENGKRYFSSDFLMSAVSELLSGYMDINIHAISGPSLPTSDHTGIIHIDSVNAFCCVFSDLRQAFISRPRPSNRPSRNVLNKISNMDAHVVPVGCKESDTSCQEWRICFTEAEIHLIHNCNEVETKLYILLKIISKLLTYISNDITSYVMKNIALWVFELYPATMFTEELLTSQLLQALSFLRKCVKANYLPSYMIPDRNLLAGRLEPVQRRKLTSFLSTLIREEGSLLLRCEKLQVAMPILYREPDRAEEFRMRRDKVEKIYLLRMNYIYYKMVTTGLPIEQSLQLAYTDSSYNSIIRALRQMTVPEWQVLLLQGYSSEALATLRSERLEQLLS